jgi:hypothetical protein
MPQKPGKNIKIYKMNDTPKLVDYNSLSYLKQELKKSNHTQTLLNTLILNTVLLIIFGITMAIVLYLRYSKKHQTPEIKRKNNLMILEKITTLKSGIKHEDPELITNLPRFSTVM